MIKTETKKASRADDYNPPVDFLKKIGPDTAKILHAAGIDTLADLLCLTPEFYIDPAWVLPVDKFLKNPPSDGSLVYVTGRVRDAGECFSQVKNKGWLQAEIESHGQELTLVWNNYSLPGLEANIRMDHYLIACGKLTGKKIVDAKIINLGSAYPWPLDKSRTFAYPFVKDLPPSRLRNIIYCNAVQYRRRLDFLVDQEAWQKMKRLLPSTAIYLLNVDWPIEDIAYLNEQTSAAHESLKALKKVLAKAKVSVKTKT